MPARAETIRVAVTRLDEPRVEQTIFASVDELCPQLLQARPDRPWGLGCRRPRAVADALRRSPLLAGAKVRIVAGGRVVIRLAFSWRHFPRVLAAIRTRLPGSFHVVERSGARIVARRGSKRVVFVRMEPHAAAAAFLRGRLDEAPVPVGDLGALRRDPDERSAVRVTQLLGVDLVDFGGALARFPALRRAYFDTADREMYRVLVAERAAPTTISLLHRGSDVTPARFRSAKDAILDLPRVRVPFQLPTGPTDRYAASFLFSVWRDVQLGPALLPQAAMRFRRVIAPYAAPEALMLAAAPRDALVRRALGLARPGPALERADVSLRRHARLLPLAWVADARLVSRCLRGWRENRLGRVDYRRVSRLADCG